MGIVGRAGAGMGPMWMVPKCWGDMGKCVPVRNGIRWSRVLATPRMLMMFVVTDGAIVCATWNAVQ